jgi:hypothetical protein
VSRQKLVILAIVLAIVAVFVIAGISYQFFPTREAPLDEIGYHTLPLLDVTLSQYPETSSTNYFRITKGETLKINLTVSSLSNDKEFTLPLYLSVGAFENEPLPSSIMITSPPPPYPDLPYPSYDVSITAPKPFEASFDPNPLIIKPDESATSLLTITTLEAAEEGTYTMFVHLGNSEETGLSGATFHLTVMPSTGGI